ncbi:hypothetical protein H0H87_009974 [Tephrocybe sp. NHM501043]|nr:hypothetical protein H0H87_009974 [Tephrocybe sp. NHM501043]
MSQNLQVIIDSISTDDLIYIGGPNGSWSVEEEQKWFGGSSAWSSQRGHPPTSGSLDITFTGAFLYYLLLVDDAETAHSVRQRNNLLWTLTTSRDFSGNDTGSYCQWWQSPPLGDGTHSIRLDGLTQTSLDFVTVSVSDTKLTAGQQIIIDDTDPLLKYNGKWYLNTDPFTVPGKKHTVVPFHNTTHQSNTIGDSVDLHFLGSSIAIYGVLSWSNAAGGSIQAQYTLDFKKTVKIYNVNNRNSSGGHLQNFLLFSGDHLDAGAHVLVIEITDCENLTFILDYVVYTSSASTMGALKQFSPPTTVLPQATPQLTQLTSVVHSPDSLLSTSHSSLTSNHLIIPSGITTTTTSESILPTIVTSTRTGPISTVPATKSSSNLRAGEIAAIVVGIVVLTILVFAAIVYWRCRRKRPHRFHRLRTENMASQPDVLPTYKESRPATPVVPFTLLHPSEGSPAAVVPTSEKGAIAMGSYNTASGTFEHDVYLPTLHRRSGSGNRRDYSGDGESSGDSHHAEARSSTDIGINIGGKPPSYKL